MREQILAAAMLIASVPGGGGFKRLTRERIAKRASTTPSLVTYYFGGMPQLRDAVVKQAIADQNLVALGAAIGDRHPLALKVPTELRAKALKTLYA
jgi:AcrR family transcriptional regulator